MMTRPWNNITSDNLTLQKYYVMSSREIIHKKTENMPKNKK